MHEVVSPIDELPPAPARIARPLARNRAGIQTKMGQRKRDVPQVTHYELAGSPPPTVSPSDTPLLCRGVRQQCYLPFN